MKKKVCDLTDDDVVLIPTTDSYTGQPSGNWQCYSPGELVTCPIEGEHERGWPRYCRNDFHSDDEVTVKEKS